MKNIKDLKDDILNKNVGNLFVFGGNEWAIKKHYINKIAEDYKVVKYLDDSIALSESMSTRGLLQRKTLYIVPHDFDFLKSSAKDFENLIKRILNSKNGAIWIYSFDIQDDDKEHKTYPKTFLTYFDDYITEFEEVEEDIFYELIAHEISLLPQHSRLLCKSCKRNYGTALLEIDKIKNYAESQKVSYDVAFEDLYRNGILNIEKEEFNCSEFMNSLLTLNMDGISKNLKRLYDCNFENVWYHLEEMVQDLKIAYCLKKYGYWKGSDIAFNNKKLYWGRIKEIRDLGGRDEYGKPILNIVWDENVLQMLILNLSMYDYKVKQGSITSKDVIENIFYYLI